MEKKEPKGTRINKYISDYGFCSRREADQLIVDDRVTINNRPAQAGDRVADGDIVRIDGETLVYIPKEARPKSHRWGPPRTTGDETADASKRKAGSRGAARNGKPSAKSATKSTSAKTAVKPTKGKTTQTRGTAPANSKKRK